MTHVIIYNWITSKYVGLMKAYLEKIVPNVADAWRADKLYLKIKNNLKYLYALMDDQHTYNANKNMDNIQLIVM
jgi:transposase-like protein